MKFEKLSEEGYPVRGATAQLLEGGGLAALIPGYRANPIQVDLADRIAAAVGAPAVGEQLEGQITLLQAPVGVGKSVAALLPLALQAILTDEQLVISTSTIQLQRQLLAEFAEVVAPRSRRRSARPRGPASSSGCARGSTGRAWSGCAAPRASRSSMHGFTRTRVRRGSTRRSSSTILSCPGEFGRSMSA